MSKRKTRARPRPQSLERLEAELRGEWPKRVCCSECVYRGRTAGECENPESVKVGDYVLPGMGCPKGQKG